MKNWLLILGLLLLVLGGCSPEKQLEREFLSPPEEVQTAVFWYWISGNISQEGVVRDLDAMKAAGINRVFIGDVCQPKLSREGSVKTMSDEWWAILHTALKHASELGIEVGLFNCPGWSQSGGPWVTPEESMRYLATSTHTFSGPQSLQLNLTPAHWQGKEGDFEPVKTLAFPAPREFGSEAKIAEIRLSDPKTALNALLPNQPNRIEIDLEEPTPIRSVVLEPTHRPIRCQACLEALVDGDWQECQTFTIERYNAQPGAGFDPYAPIVLSFAPITAQHWRLELGPTRLAGGFDRISLSPQPRIVSYPEKTLAKMCQHPLPAWDHYLWRPTAEVEGSEWAIRPEAVVDLSDRVTPDGTLEWEVPEGEWVILHSGMTSTGMTNTPATPEATGLEIDKMSSRHVRKHFDAYVGEVLRRIPVEDRKTFRVVVQDSYEAGSQNFTDQMMEEFEAAYGYSMIPFLPTFGGWVVQSQEQSDRFLWDLRRFIADRVAYAYVGGLREVSHEHGLTTWLQCYGHAGFPGEFLQYGGQSDEVSGEFWSTGSLGSIEVRNASSCGHTYNKRRIWAESCTSSGTTFQHAPVDLKQRIDRFFSEGVNATLLHLYIAQPDTTSLPGVNAWFGTEFNRKNTWFRQVDLFTSYLKRCSYLLQQGLNVADVAYFIGEDAPKMRGIQSPALPVGYQFDYINAEVLLRDAEVQKGRITLPHGTSYRLLVLPPQETMRPEVLHKIEELVRDGATVLGPPPHRSPSLENYPQADGRVEQCARNLWGDCYDTPGYNPYGRGGVYHGLTLEEVFAQMGVTPDCSFAPKSPLLYAHRTTPREEIYFLSSQSQTAGLWEVTFRVPSGMIPERWDPVSGRRYRLEPLREGAEGVTLALDFAPIESCFILFRRAVGEACPKALVSDSLRPIPLTAPWNLSFEGPISIPEPMQCSSLFDLSESEQESVRYFSGTIHYRTTLPPLTGTPERVVLDLGGLHSMAKVYLNGRYVGGVWSYPYRVEIPGVLLDGDNDLHVEVVNLWANRLIGEMQRPAEERRITLSTNPFTASSPLPPSGLVGPVQLLVADAQNP